MNTEIDLPVARLLSEFPALARVRPLAVGIRADLVAAGWTDHEAAAALTWYCTRAAYLRACQISGATRYDLHGNPRGKVSQAEAVHAYKVLPSYEGVERRQRFARELQGLPDA